MKTTKNSINFTRLALLTGACVLQMAATQVWAWYNPQAGRWLSRDPVGEPGSQVLQATYTQPQQNGGPALPPGRWFKRDPMTTKGEPNPYAFVGNAPTKRIDRNGLDWVEDENGYPIPPKPPPSKYCAKFDAWYQNEKQKLTWLQGLPDCPCRLTCVKPWFTWSALDPDWSVWHSPSTWTFGYHPGAKWCMRSKTTTSGGAGQQCCFDSNGKLITHGPGAGTPDKVSPDVDNFGSSGHQGVDVDPYDWALTCDGGTPGESVHKYLEVRPPNNGKACEKNP